MALALSHFELTNANHITSGKASVRIPGRSIEAVMVTAQIKEHTVFVGNIPYGELRSFSTLAYPRLLTRSIGLTEEQIVHVLSQAGQVLNFRLVYDKDSGRPRGYGFAEFSDNDAAASAVRNLNNYETMGRHLRVDWSNDGPSKDDRSGNPTSNDSNPQSLNGPNTTQSQSNALPSLPPGTELPAGISCNDQISTTLRAIHPSQLLDTLLQMKSLVDTAPQQAFQLLTQAPQLSFALFQALLLLGLVDSSVLQHVLTDASAQNRPQPSQQMPSQQLPPQQMPPQQMPPQQMPTQQMPPLQMPQQNFQQAPQPLPQPLPQQPTMPAIRQQPQFQAVQTATPPGQQSQYQAPGTANSSPAMNHQEIMRQVMGMSQEQISQMTPEQQNWIIAIRQQAGIR